MLSYKKAFAIIKQNGLRADKIINHAAYTRMRNGGHITTRTIDKLCAALNCQPGDLVEYIPDDTDTPTA